MKKDTTFSIRISSEDLETIKRKAEQARCVWQVKM